MSVRRRPGLLLALLVLLFTSSEVAGAAVPLIINQLGKGTTPLDGGWATEPAVAFGQEDDITVLTLTRLGVGEASTARFSAPVFETAG